VRSQPLTQIKTKYGVFERKILRTICENEECEFEIRTHEKLRSFYEEARNEGVIKRVRIRWDRYVWR